MVTLILSLCVLALAGTLWGVLKAHKAEARDRARERTTLLSSNRDLTDRIMYAQGVTWTPPPRPELVEEKEVLEQNWVDV